VKFVKVESTCKKLFYNEFGEAFLYLFIIIYILQLKMFKAYEKQS